MPAALFDYLLQYPNEVEKFLCPEFYKIVHDVPKIMREARAIEVKRAIHVSFFCWASLDTSDLQFIAHYYPFVEVGAGSGLYSFLLNKLGVRAHAYDVCAGGKLAVREFSHYWTKLISYWFVEYGNEEIVTKFPDHTLLLFWPTDSDWPLACLKKYEGSVVIYVGEPPRGRCATPAFFDYLDRHFICKEVKTVSKNLYSPSFIYVFTRKLNQTTIDISRRILYSASQLSTINAKL